MLVALTRAHVALAYLALVVRWRPFAEYPMKIRVWCTTRTLLTRRWRRLSARHTILCYPRPRKLMNIGHLDTTRTGIGVESVWKVGRSESTIARESTKSSSPQLHSTIFT